MSQSLEELLVAVVALMLLEAEVAILVGLEVGLGPEAPPAQVAHVRLLLGVHAHVGLQRASCNKKHSRQKKYLLTLAEVFMRYGSRHIRVGNSFFNSLSLF